MLQVIDKTEIAARKPYKYSDKVSQRMRKEKKAREMKRKLMAKNITKVDNLTEIVEDIENDDIFNGNGNILNKLLEN